MKWSRRRTAHLSVALAASAVAMRSACRGRIACESRSRTRESRAAAFTTSNTAPIHAAGRR